MQSSDHSLKTSAWDSHPVWKVQLLTDKMNKDVGLYHLVVLGRFNTLTTWPSQMDRVKMISDALSSWSICMFVSALLGTMEGGKQLPMTHSWQDGSWLFSLIIHFLIQRKKGKVERSFFAVISTCLKLMDAFLPWKESSHSVNRWAIEECPSLHTY